MPKPEQIPIQRHMGLGELNKKISALEKYNKILRRLYFIKCRYGGMSVVAAARQVGITKSVAYNWQRRWNEDGYAGIIPRHAGGRPSKLSESQKKQLVTLLSQKSYWTTVEVKDLIFREFEAEYSPKQVRVILKKLGTGYAEPCDNSLLDSGECNLCQLAIH